MEAFGVSITSDPASNDAFTVRIGGRSIRTIVTDDDDLAQQWITDVRSMHRKHRGHLVVGLRLYYRATQGKCDIFRDERTSIIVLFIGSDCLIYEFLANVRYRSRCYRRIGKPLIDFLKDSKVKFVGIDTDRDTKKLHGDWPFFFVENGIELRSIVERHKRMREGELGTAGLEELAVAMLQRTFVGAGSPMASAVGWCWHRSFSSDEQRIKRACFEAFLSFEIGSFCMRRGLLSRQD